MIYELILGNKELSKIIYALLIMFISATVFLKSDRIFKLSDYQGLRYLRNSFLFYGLAFFSGIILSGIENPLPQYGNLYYQATNFFSHFFIIIAGFFLLYSLTWKYFEKEKSHNSIFNLNMVFFYIVAFVFSIVDLTLSTRLFTNLSQVVLFLMMSKISYGNYSGKKSPLTKYYFFAIVFGSISWILFSVLSFTGPFAVLQIFAYLASTLFFSIFLFMVIKVTKKKW